MALKFEFYKEIFEKEQIWIDSLESGLLNVFYLTEIKNFYFDKIEVLDKEVMTTGNEFIKHISFVLKNILKQVNYLIDEDKKGNLVNLMKLNDLFLINRMTNNMSYANGINLTRISNEKHDLYALRQQIIDNENLEDDFYYEDKKVI